MEYSIKIIQSKQEEEKIFEALKYRCPYSDPLSQTCCHAQTIYLSISFIKSLYHKSESIILILLNNVHMFLCKNILRLKAFKLYFMIYIFISILYNSYEN